MKPKISVVIHTLNSARMLEQVLKSVSAFDEVLICDMHSEDGTLEIARRHGCTVLMHERLGFVEPAPNFAIQSARWDWVLVVDSDELVKPELCDFLYEQITSENPPAGVRIPRENYFLGRFMRGDYPDRIVRFFRKDSVHWPPFVHEQPAVTGRVLTIPRSRRDLALVYLPNESVGARLRKTDIYTDLELQRRKGKRPTLMELRFRTWHRFFKSYVTKGGMDGIPGYIHARLQSYYQFVTLSKIWEVDYNN